MNIFITMIACIVFGLSAQSVSSDLYIYSIDDGSRILLKLKNDNYEWTQFILSADLYKQGDITRKIYKLDGNDDWKESLLLSLVRKSMPQEEYPSSVEFAPAEYYRFIRYVQDQIKTGYSVIINSNPPLKVFDVNRMLMNQPDTDSMRRLAYFGYGIENADANELYKKIKMGDISLILPVPFRNPFLSAIKEYSLNIPKQRNVQLYVYILLIALIIVVSALAIYMRVKQNKMLKQSKLNYEKLNQQYKSLLSSKEQKEASPQIQEEDLSQAEKRHLNTTLSAINDIRQLLEERASPAYRIQKLIESIAQKVNGKWAEASSKKLKEILRDNLLIPEQVHLPVKNSFDEFSKTDWRSQFLPIMDRLDHPELSYDLADDRSRRAIESIAHNVIATVVELADSEESNHTLGKPDSAEADIKELISLTGIKEMDVKPGQVYNPEMHELIIDNSRSMTTDREQRITRVISRGLLLPDGKIVKAKVSIQK